ncbi:Uncharacterized protein APZ42_023563 [Daphnia magna]|uniref:Uncharacterized protein n=1 Tax=Daphnia magna TaxID=35525 RepID=A0A164URK3_9CRUS|nr:Uncharacterized protein APZ42_023563 [Daphnia magna]
MFVVQCILTVSDQQGVNRLVLHSRQLQTPAESKLQSARFAYQVAGLFGYSSTLSPFPYVTGELFMAVN